jgi:hypothetical protein
MLYCKYEMYVTVVSGYLLINHEKNHANLVEGKTFCRTGIFKNTSTTDLAV